MQNTDFITDFIFVKNNPQPCEVILVPGGSRPQLAQKAAEFYNQGMAKYILFSGSANPKISDYSSEAEYLKAVAIDLGVPGENIMCDHQATHTFGNAEFSLALLQKWALELTSLYSFAKHSIAGVRFSRTNMYFLKIQNFLLQQRKMY